VDHVAPLAPLFPYTPPPPPEPSSEERIREAALKCMAARGNAATSLRVVAEAAGVSIGLVQHYYHTKAALVSAVDQYVLQVVSETLGAAAMPDAADDALVEAGNRLAKLPVNHPLVIDYLSHALTEGDEIGAVIFDGLAAISSAQGEMFAAQGATRPDLDPLWATLNPLILRVGTFILRPHIERHLGQALYTDAQLRRWDTAVTQMISRGQFN
jgi:AcrR family transcriptional regulator